MKDWCETRKQEGFEAVYMWGFVVIGDIGAFEAWSINHLQHPFEKKFAPDVGVQKKGAKKEKTYYSKLGVQDRWFFPLFGMKFKVFDLAPLASTMSMAKLEAVGSFLTKLNKLEHTDKPEDHSNCLHKFERCPHGDPSHLVRVDSGPLVSKEHPWKDFPWKCPAYAMRDAEITLAFAKYLLAQGLNPERIGTPGQLASAWFEPPVRNQGGIISEFESNLRLYGSFAGRNECFRNGGPYKAAYVDRTSLYPESMLRCKATMIRDTEECSIDDIDMKPGWSSDAYGWGLFPELKNDDSVWSFPKRQENVVYVTGTFAGGDRGILRATDDLIAGQTQITQEPSWVCRPVFAPRGSVEETISNKLEELFDQRVKEQLPFERKGLLKGAMNALSGKYGAADPHAGSTTNYLTYSALLARSHLLMADFCRWAKTTHNAELYGFDTDGTVLSLPLRETGTRDGIPYRFGVQEKTSADGKKHEMVGQMIYYRAKQYVMECDDGATVSAQHGWHYEWGKFEKLGKRLIMKGKEPDGESFFEEDKFVVWKETKRTVDTATKAVKMFRLGGWIDEKVGLTELDLARLLWADRKRDRGDYIKEPELYNSYLLAKDGKFVDSKPWTWKAWNSFSLAEMKRRRKEFWKNEIKIANETFSDTSQLSHLHIGFEDAKNPLGVNDAQLDKLLKTVLKARSRRGLDPLSRKVLKV